MSTQALSWVLDHSESTGAARLVAIAIANHVDCDTAEGWSYVSTILNTAKVSLDSYHRAVKALEDLGEFERTPNAGGTPKTRADAKPNLFRMPKFGLTRPLQDAYPAGKRPRQDAHPRPPQGADPAPSAGCLPIPITGSPVTDPSENPPGPAAQIVELFPTEQPPLFEDFWERYPRRNGRKVGRAAAVAKWEKIRTHERVLVMAAVTAYARACDQGQTLAKDAERFLGRDYWRDWLGVEIGAPRKPGDRPMTQDRESGSGRVQVTRA